MADKKIPTRTINVIFRPAPRALKVVVVVLILVCCGALAALRWVHLDYQMENQALRDQAAGIEYANAELAGKQNLPDSVRNVQEIARQELGLVDPDTVVIDPIS